MATKKNTPTPEPDEPATEAVADEDATPIDVSGVEGIVPKQLDPDSTSPAPEVTDEPADSVGEAVESTDPGPTGPPAPITPATAPRAKYERVLYENVVNGEAENFARVARDMYITHTLAGRTVEIVVTPDPNADTDD